MPPSPACMFPDFPAEDQRYHHDGVLRAMRRVLESGRFILGEEVAAFEAEMAAFLDVSHVIGVGSGTDAIELLLRGLGVQGNGSVVLPALAPSAVAAAVRRAGAEILLADVDDETLTLCPRALKAVLESPQGRSVRAVLAVHLYGHPAAWDELSGVCAAHDVLLIEDAAQAHGAAYASKKAGTLGMAAAWSFYPTKNLGALGDAGAISTTNGELAAKLRQMREYGWKQRHISDMAGINSRLDELQAAVLRVKLPDLAAQVEKRCELAARYTQRLHGVRVPVTREGCGNAWHQFVIRSTGREALRRHLQSRGVPTAVHYPAALHQQPAFACAGDFRVAERAVAEVLSLPLHPYLTEEAVDAVCAVIAECPA